MANRDPRAEQHPAISTAPSPHPHEGSALHHWSKYLAMGASVVNHVLEACITDIRLLARRWKGGLVFRQASTPDFSMLVRANEEVGRQIYCRRRFEIEESDFIRRNIRDTDTCFDVGANIGYYTLLLAKLSPRGQVHSFEPVPMNCHVLSINLLANKITNAFLNQGALGDSQQEVNFMVTEDAGYSSFVDTGRKAVLATMRVQMDTLDNYCRERNVPRIDFLKVDVEGAESKVIQGGASIFENRQRRPRFLMLELNESMLRVHGSSIPRVLRQMRSLGYRPFLYLHKTLVPFQLQHFGLHENVFFLPEDF